MQENLVIKYHGHYLYGKQGKMNHFCANKRKTKQTTEAHMIRETERKKPAHNVCRTGKLALRNNHLPTPTTSNKIGYAFSRSI